MSHDIPEQKTTYIDCWRPHVSKYKPISWRLHLHARKASVTAKPRLTGPMSPFYKPHSGYAENDINNWASGDCPLHVVFPAGTRAIRSCRRRANISIVIAQPTIIPKLRVFLSCSTGGHFSRSGDLRPVPTSTPSANPYTEMKKIPHTNCK